LIESLISKSN
jgi:histone H3